MADITLETLGRVGAAEVFSRTVRDGEGFGVDGLVCGDESGSSVGFLGKGALVDGTDIGHTTTSVAKNRGQLDGAGDVLLR